MKCRKCLTRLPRKANYCPRCGRSATGDEECIEETLKETKTGKQNNYEILSRFAKNQRNEFLKERKKGRRRVCLDPDSLMAREIMYQTALLHEVLDKVRGEKISP